MNATVNVLAVMLASRAHLQASGSARYADRVLKAHDAIAELLEATGALTDAIEFRIDDPRAAMLDRVVAALLRAT